MMASAAAFDGLRSDAWPVKTFESDHPRCKGGYWPTSPTDVTPGIACKTSIMRFSKVGIASPV